jgi:hypothetical protein
MRDIRLGDDIDDFCVRCKRIMNHAVVSVIAAAPAKVRCRTCHSDHDYRHEQAPPPKVDSRKAALFHEVLKKVAPDGATAVDDADAADAAPEVDLETDTEVLGESEAEVVEMAAVEAVEEAPPAEPGPRGAPRGSGASEPKSKAKPKAKAKTKK